METIKYVLKPFLNFYFMSLTLKVAELLITAEGGRRLLTLSTADGLLPFEVAARRIGKEIDDIVEDEVCINLRKKIRIFFS